LWVPFARTAPASPRQFTQLLASVRRFGDHRLPGRVIGLLQKLLRGGWSEIESFDPGLGLALALGLDQGDVLVVERFDPDRGIGQDFALRVG
jgi:hypothetical protein